MQSPSCSKIDRDFLSGHGRADRDLAVAMFRVRLRVPVPAPLVLGRHCLQPAGDGRLWCLRLRNRSDGDGRGIFSFGGMPCYACYSCYTRTASAFVFAAPPRYSCYICYGVRGWRAKRSRRSSGIGRTGDLERAIGHGHALPVRRSTRGRFDVSTVQLWAVRIPIASSAASFVRVAPGPN
jgi:hypothetical protein